MGGQHGYRGAERAAVSRRGGNDRSGILDFSEAGAGDDAGTAVGIGLGSFALGSELGSTAHPYYNPYYYPYGYAYPAPAYYPPAPYYPPRSCWDPYYRAYYACRQACRGIWKRGVRA